MKYLRKTPHKKPTREGLITISEMSSPLTLPTWTPAQAAALHGIRTAMGAFGPTFGQAQSLAERAHVPSEGIPEGVHISCELAPPSSQIPASIHSTSIQPGQVPVFFYADAPSESFTDAKNDIKVVFHVHGGGNVSGHPMEQRFIAFFSRILRALGKKSGPQGSSSPMIAAPSYRLATVAENLFPAGLQDVFSAYHHLILKGFDAENITITGDSAGGNLALVLTYIISQSNLPMPGHVALFSPDADLTYTTSTSVPHDIIPLLTYQACSSQYLGNFPANDPLASGILIPFTASWPKTLVMTGTADNVAESSRRIVNGIKKAGGIAELVEYADLTHAWWMFSHIFLQSDDGLDRLAVFVYN
ncbi:Alpha/Beta hydrolase protein [Suillus clintonianus]|uniref:Alpha/Beta hydrolase protein n=1 Tax=Suillus clintonianus TaxID=1904413 RepID=UPI001B885D95|nr:Alpha/Beta hydrolase protein [Suillus clintonianus]KAG2141280.1 Alpha/Beta hydrolase protein [Suillus clintonianus]